ncbi:MAG: prepilin-type N-terminal cleavage/methylation domain-containing protein [bacterium]|nr:prepilin-type N-terminal cleavage/methylation domain-containing protein [bacterium]
MHYFNTQNRGFTLIELLVVVAIIGVLAAASIANVTGAIERADAAASQANLRAIHTALMAYRTDYGAFPPADGTAGSTPSPGQTTYGCGPAANGFWSGIPLQLAERGYCAEENLYDPALRRTYRQSIPAWPSCASGDFGRREVAQWKFMRYAYNYAAVDAGGAAGGEADIEHDAASVWLARSLHLDVGLFDPDRAIPFPYRLGPDEKSPGQTWYGEFELTVGGTIQPRRVQLRR